MGRIKGGLFWQTSKKTGISIHTFYRLNQMHKTTLEWSPEGVGVLDFFIEVPSTVNITDGEAKTILKKHFNQLSEGKRLNVIINNQYSTRKKKRMRIIRAQHLFKKATRPTEEEAYEYEKKIAEFKNECMAFQDE